MPTNDNYVETRGSGRPVVDAAGQAALILVESLLHGLTARAVLSTGESLDIVTSAIEVQADVATEAQEAAAAMWRSHALLSGIADSLRTDL